MMSIEMAGAVYCPLSPSDPEQRLVNLIEQTQCRLVLVHSRTLEKFQNSPSILDIETIIHTAASNKNLDLDRFSNINITSDSLAYVIFTSGSTGTPKAVSCQRRLFWTSTNCRYSHHRRK